MIELNLPYHDKRNAQIDTLVLHCLAYDVDEGIEKFKENNVSSHYLIDMNGKIYCLVSEDKHGIVVSAIGKERQN